MATQKKANRIDEDNTSLYEMDVPNHKPDAYDIQVMDIIDEEEEHMLKVFHQQYVAIEGRPAITKVVHARIGELTSNTSLTMAAVAENMYCIESNAQVGRFAEKLERFNNKLFDNTGKRLMVTNAIAVRTMQDDMRTDVYKPRPVPPPPPRRRRKGLIPAIAEFFVGEE